MLLLFCPWGLLSLEKMLENWIDCCDCGIMKSHTDWYVGYITVYLHDILLNKYNNILALNTEWPDGNQCSWSSLHARRILHFQDDVCVCDCLLSVSVCQEVDCCGGGGVRGCRAPNEGVRNKISALGSSSARHLPQTPSDWKWNSCDDLIYMLLTNRPPENRPINDFLLLPVSPTTQGNGGVEWGGGKEKCVKEKRRQ